MGMFLARAAAKSATFSSTAVETMSAAQSSVTPLPSWGMISMPRRSSCVAKLGTLAAVEGAIAAADTPAHHRLELRERAHAGTAKPRVMKSPMDPLGRE